MTGQISIDIPPIYGNIFAPYRYKMYHGGRGGGKSTTIADYIVASMVMNQERVLCAREFQNSIEDSVFALIKERVEYLGLEPWFKFTKNSIQTINGSQAIFKGLARNIGSVKSLQGITKVWCEEAQYLSQNSLDILLPTIRKAGSQFIASWNDLDEDTPIEVMRKSVVNSRDALIGKINWRHNKFWTKELEMERVRYKESFPNEYDNVFEGEFRRTGHAYFDIERLGPMANLPSCDYVFAVIDTVLKGGANNKKVDGTAIAYWAYDSMSECKLILVDYDIVEIGSDVLGEWIPTQCTHGAEIARQLGARRGFLGCYVEDKAAGSVVIPQLQRAGHQIFAIPSGMTALGKDGRAISISDYYSQKLIGIMQYAWDKRVVYKGEEKNHLLSQIKSYSLNDPKSATRADDLFDVFVYGPLLAFDA